MEAKTDKASDTTLSVGAHRVQFSPPGLIRVEWNGPCSRDDFARVIEWTDQQVQRKPYVMLANLARLGIVDPEARRFSATDTRFSYITRIAFIGASFQHRVIITLISRAIDFFHKEQRGQMRFFDSEADALNWLTQEYAQIHAAIGE